MVSGWSPSAAFGRPNALRYAPMPMNATTRGRYFFTSRRNRTPPATYSSGDSSAAAAVVRGTMLVMPYPSGSSSRSSQGENNRGVNPAPCSAGQNRLPGRAK